MSYRGAAREGLASASSLADAAMDGRTVPLGEAGRRCEVCPKLLARLNRGKLCFAWQAERDDRILRSQARPVSMEDLLRRDPQRLHGRRAGR